MKNIYTIISIFLITSLAYTMLAKIDFTEEFDDFDEVEFFDDFDEAMTEKKAKKSIGYFLKRESPLLIFLLLPLFHIYLNLELPILSSNPEFKSFLLFFIAGIILSSLGLVISDFYDYTIIINGPKIFVLSFFCFVLLAESLCNWTEENIILAQASKFINVVLFFLIIIALYLGSILVFLFYNVHIEGFFVTYTFLFILFGNR